MYRGSVSWGSLNFCSIVKASWFLLDGFYTLYTSPFAEMRVSFWRERRNTGPGCVVWQVLVCCLGSKRCGLSPIQPMSREQLESNIIFTHLHRMIWFKGSDTPKPTVTTICTLLQQADSKHVKT